MTTLIFFPNEHLLAWVYHAPALAPSAVIAAVRLGTWPFPLTWRRMLDEQFIVPEPLVLSATSHGDMVVVRPEQALQERTPGRFIPLTPGQAQVIGLMAQGLTTGQIALRMRIRRRWVKYHVAEVKRRLGAITRSQAVAKRFDS